MKVISVLCGCVLSLTLNVYAEKLALAGGTAINPADEKITENAVVVIDGNTIQSVEDISRASDIDSVIKNGIVYPAASLLP